MLISGKYKGQEFTINEREAFEAAEAIEDHITVFELGAMMNDLRKVQVARLAKAYAALLRVAGVQADPMEIKREITTAFKSKGSSKEKAGASFEAVAAVAGPLLEVLMDGSDEVEQSSEGNTTENPPEPAS